MSKIKTKTAAVTAIKSKKPSKTKQSTRSAGKGSPSRSKAELRVRIAKEALKHLNSESIKPAARDWLELNGVKELAWVYENAVDSLPEGETEVNFNHEVEDAVRAGRCKVDVTGALFVGICTTGCRRIMINDVEAAEDMFNNMNMFSDDQLHLMEVAYHGKNGLKGLWSLLDCAADQVTCETFHRTHRTPKMRLKAILENIIRNKGTFVPQSDVNLESVLEYIGTTEPLSLYA